MPVSKPPPPPAGVTIDLTNKDVIKAACMIQKSFRGHQIRARMKEDGPPKFIEELEDSSTMEESTHRIVGQITGFPDPTVKWFKDGQDIKEGTHYAIKFEDPNLCVLIVRNCTQDDAGTYTCKLYNKFGEAFDSAKLKVHGSAKIVTGLKNAQHKCGEKVVLTAKIIGEPLPDIGWAKDGVDVDEDDRLSWDIEDDTTTLTIKNCNKKDAGKYEVYCENEYGYDHSFSTVHVK